MRACTRHRIRWRATQTTSATLADRSAADRARLLDAELVDVRIVEVENVVGLAGNDLSHVAGA